MSGLIDDDEDLCRRAAHLHRTDPRAADGILFECFNWIDADNLRRKMAAIAPDVPIYFTVMFDYPPRGTRRDP